MTYFKELIFSILALLSSTALLGYEDTLDVNIPLPRINSCTELSDYIDNIYQKKAYHQKTTMVALNHFSEMAFIQDCACYPSFLNLQGLIYYLKNNVVESRLALSKSQSELLSKPSSNIVDLINNKIYFGLSYNLQNEFSNAYNYFEEAYRLAKDHNLIDLQANALLNLGLVNLEINDLEQAKNKLLQSESLIESIDNYETKGFITQNLSRVFLQLKDYESSYEYIKKCQSIWKKNSDNAGIYYSLQIEAQYQKDANQNVLAAIEAYQESLRYGELENLTLVNGEINKKIGDLYLELGEIDSTTYYYTKALENTNQFELEDLEGMYDFLLKELSKDFEKNQIGISRLVPKLFEQISESKTIQKLETSRLLSNEIILEKEKANLVELEYKTSLQRLYNTLLLFGLLGLIILIFFMVKSNRVKKKFLTTIKNQNISLENKNTELKNFVNIVSHDLKAPTKTITSFSKLLAKELDDSEVEYNKKYLEFIQTSGQNMHNLVTDLLEYSTVGSDGVHFSMIDIKALIEYTLMDLTSIIEEREAVVSLVGQFPKLVFGDKIKLGLVFQNLINNAIKFVKPGQQPKVEISYNESSHYHEFVVTDNGIGISDDFKERVFLMFQRLDNQYQGSGIGLATCTRIVKLHKGEIGVKNNVPTGSIFYFTIAKQLS